MASIDDASVSDRPSSISVISSSSSNSEMASAAWAVSSCANTCARRRGSSCSIMSAMSAGCSSPSVLCDTES